MKKIFTILFATLVLVGCKNTKESKELGDQNAGKTLTGWYYYHLMQHNYDSLPKLMNDDTADIQAFIKVLKDREEKLGSIKSFEIKDWEKTSQNKKEKTKDFIIEYDVTYQNAKSLETIYLNKKGNDLKITKIEYEEEK